MIDACSQSMVSPIKIWQHPQPKRRWLALVGLSVLAHIGVLGLSLPYVLDLMQLGQSSSTAASAIPIDLVTAEPEAHSERMGDRSQPSSSQSSSSQPSSSQSSGTEAPAAPVQASPAASQSVQSEAASAGAITSVNTDTNQESRDPLSAVSDQAASNTSENSDIDRRDLDEGTQPDQDVRADNSGRTQSSSNSAGEETAADPANPQGEDGADSTTEGAENGSPALPAAPGNQTLPSPGNEAANRDNSAPQSAFLSVVEFSEAPGQRDVGKTPPKPKEGTLASGVVLDPTAVGCPRLAFSQQQWQYLVTVEDSGRVERATVWTERISRTLSEEEEAIACLIENSGLEFEPALFEGEPIKDDNLLLTIDVIEMNP